MCHSQLPEVVQERGMDEFGLEVTRKTAFIWLDFMYHVYMVTKSNVFFLSYLNPICFISVMFMTHYLCDVKHELPGFKLGCCG